MNYEEKYKKVIKVSNPAIVMKKLNELIPNTKLFISNQKNKKYKIYDPENDKFIHFGSIDFEDYTYHNDNNRRQKFINRNNKWKDAPMYSPAFLSFHLLW